jgi:MYND finger
MSEVSRWFGAIGLHIECFAPFLSKFIVISLSFSPGYAYHKIGKFRDAEREFVKAVCFSRKCSTDNRKSTPHWDLKSEQNSRLILGLISCYTHWQKDDSGVGNESAGYHPARAAISLFCLLSTAGFWPLVFYLNRCESVGSTANAMSPIVLKSKYQTQKKAKQQLQRALETSDVSGFRAALEGASKQVLQSSQIFTFFAALQEDAFQSPFHNPLMDHRVRPSQSRKQTAKQDMRNWLNMDRMWTGSQDEVCSNCRLSFSVSDLFFCPCKLVKYCGKQCQIAHWRKGHKSFCPSKNAK